MEEESSGRDRTCPVTLERRTRSLTRPHSITRYTQFSPSPCQLALVGSDFLSSWLTSYSSTDATPIHTVCFVSRSLRFTNSSFSLIFQVAVLRSIHFDRGHAAENFWFCQNCQPLGRINIEKVYIADSCSFTSVDPDKDDHLEMADLEKSTFDFSEKGWTMEQTGITKNEHHSWSSSLHSHILLDLCLASIFSSRNSK